MKTHRLFWLLSAKVFEQKLDQLRTKHGLKSTKERNPGAMCEGESEFTVAVCLITACILDSMTELVVKVSKDSDDDFYRDNLALRFSQDMNMDDATKFIYQATQRTKLLIGEPPAETKK